MGDTVPVPEDWSDSDAAEAWLRTQPREVCVALAARAALRVLPLAIHALNRRSSDRRSRLLLPAFRAAAAAWSAGVRSWPREVVTCAAVASNIAINAAADLAAESRADADAATHAGVDAAAAAADASEAAAAVLDATTNPLHAAARATARAADEAADAAAYVSGAAAAHAAFTADIRAILPRGNALALLLAPLWPSEPPDWADAAWSNLCDHVLAADEGWEVWTTWYEARLKGGPVDVDLETKRVIGPKRWKEGPKAVNAEIAAIIADHLVNKPAGETLEVHPATGRIAAAPAVVDNRPAYANARDKVADALEDYRASPVANIARALDPFVARLTRAVTRYADNPLRLHDDFEDCAREIARAVDADPDLDRAEVRALRDTAGVGAIDLRNHVPEVAENHKVRRPWLTRAPSLQSRSAARRLLQEIGEGLDPALREDMADDVATVEQSDAPGDTVLAEGPTRSAVQRLALRFAWLYRFSRMHPEETAALAVRVGRNFEEIERLVTLIGGAREWWRVIQLMMNAL
jgi:hypothetical protein